MLKPEDRFTYKEYLSPNELLPMNVKVQALNGMKARLDKIQTDASTLIESEDIANGVLSAIDSLMMVLEDSYKINFYKFQFKILTASMNKEIKTLEEIIQYGK